MLRCLKKVLYVGIIACTVADLSAAACQHEDIKPSLVHVLTVVTEKIPSDEHIPSEQIDRMDVVEVIKVLDLYVGKLLEVITLYDQEVSNMEPVLEDLKAKIRRLQTQIEGKDREITGLFERLEQDKKAPHQIQAQNLREAIRFWKTLSVALFSVVGGVLASAVIPRMLGSHDHDLD